MLPASSPLEPEFFASCRGDPDVLHASIPLIYEEPRHIPQPHFSGDRTANSNLQNAAGDYARTRFGSEAVAHLVPAKNGQGP